MLNNARSAKMIEHKNEYESDQDKGGPSKGGFLNWYIYIYIYIDLLYSIHLYAVQFICLFLI